MPSSCCPPCGPLAIKTYAAGAARREEHLHRGGAGRRAVRLRGGRRSFPAHAPLRLAEKVARPPEKSEWGFAFSVTGIWKPDCVALGANVFAMEQTLITEQTLEENLLMVIKGL